MGSGRHLSIQDVPQQTSLPCQVERMAFFRQFLGTPRKPRKFARIIRGISQETFERTHNTQSRSKRKEEAVRHQGLNRGRSSSSRNASRRNRCGLLARSQSPLKAQGRASLNRGQCHRYDFLVRLWNGLNFFELFKLYFHLGLITTPHVLYVHMTYVYSFFHVSFFTRSHGQEKSLSYCDLLYDFRSSTLRTHPHPHFLLLPPQPHHPYTPRLCRSTTDPLGEGYHPDVKCGHLAGPGCT